MPRISFAKKHRAPIEVDFGAPLMKALLAEGIPVASSCHGDGVCGKCRLKITAGTENLSSPNETELFLRDKFSLQKDLRISCQCQVHGDIEIDASYW